MLVNYTAKSFNVKCIQNTSRINMSDMDESMQKMLDDILVQYVSDGVKFMDSSLNEEVRAMVKSKLADVLLEMLKSRFLSNLESSSEIEKEFEAAVHRTWRKPLDLLDLLLIVCLEVSTDFISAQGYGASSKRNYVREALTRQQANACLVFNEIQHLLKSGFPHGAHSHWRTLHEITCISYFISKHRDRMAKRFLDYEAVEAYFQAEAIHKHRQNIDCSSLSQGDFKTLGKNFKAREKKYGDEFVKQSNYPYGWIPRTVLKARFFKEIEKSVKLDTFRPYYDLAGYNLYGDHNTLVFKVGAKKKKSRVVIPVGPSNFGLADPGKNAAISLGQVTACLLMSGSNIKRLVIVEALRNLVDEICDAFSEVEAEFGKE